MPDPSLGVLLFLPYRHLEQRVLDAVVGAGYPITLAQARVFQRVDPGGSRLTRPGGGERVVQSRPPGSWWTSWWRAGTSNRVRDTTDARARLVRITRRGHDAIDVARAVQDEIEGEWRDHLGAEAFRNGSGRTCSGCARSPTPGPDARPAQSSRVVEPRASQSRTARPRSPNSGWVSVNSWSRSAAGQGDLPRRPGASRAPRSRGR